MANTSDFRNGLIFRHKDNLWKIVEFLHVKPGKGGAFVRTKIKNIKTGQVVDETFRAGEKIEVIRIEARDFNYLYNDGSLYHFMDNETYDQISLTKEQVSDDVLDFLIENTTTVIAFNNDDPVNWELAEQISKHILKDETKSYMLEDKNDESNIESIFRAIQLNYESKLDSNISDIKLASKQEWASWIIESSKHFNFSKLDTSTSNLPINISNLQSSIIGMQVGNFAGGLAKNSWGMSVVGVILPRSEKLMINYENLFKRIDGLDVDKNNAIFAALSLEYVNLNLGKFTTPIEYLIDIINTSTSKLVEEIEKLNQDVEMDMNDINSLMQNFSESTSLDIENIFNGIFAPLAFFREAVSSIAKQYSNVDDLSIFNLLLDTSIGEYGESGLNQLISKINSFSNDAQRFIEYLEESKNPNSLIEILNDKELIPSEHELLDPLSWAARTSLPPI